MNGSGRWIVNAVILSVVLVTTARADTLVTKDGRFIIGEVQKTSAGYRVKTASKNYTVGVNEVRTILWDHPPKDDGTPSSSIGSQLDQKPASRPVDPKMLSMLLQQGQAAFNAGEFAIARDAFSDALSIDPSCALAGRGLGFAYLKLQKSEKAAGPLQIAANGLPVDRPLAIGLAAALVAAHDSLGAAKVLEDYFHSSPRALDEPMINALGIALWQSDPAAMRTPAFVEGVKTYTSLDAQLEATQPSKRRWGTEWLDAAEVTDRQKARRDARVKSDAAWDQLQPLNTQMKAAQDELDRATKLKPRDPNRGKQISDAQATIDELKPRQQAAQADYDSADADLQKLPAPVFPSIIPLTDADISLPAGGGKVMRYAAGFAIAPDVVVTAADVVDTSSNIQVITSDGKTASARVLRMHRGNGLALLEISGLKLPALRLATDQHTGSMTCMALTDIELLKASPRVISVTAAEPAGPWTVKFKNSPRLPGSPLLASGLVTGVELSDRESDLNEVVAATVKELTSLAAGDAKPVQVAGDPSKAIVLVVAER